MQAEGTWTKQSDRISQEDRDEEPKSLHETGNVALRGVVLHRLVVHRRRGQRYREERTERRQPGIVLCAGAESGMRPRGQTGNGPAGPGTARTTHAARR